MAGLANLEEGKKRRVLNRILGEGIKNWKGTVFSPLDEV